MIQVISYQEKDPKLDDRWLNANDQLTHYNKAREPITDRVKVTETTFLKETDCRDGNSSRNTNFSRTKILGRFKEAGT